MQEKPLKIQGRVHIIPESDVDTDMIFHNRHLHITELEKMGRWIFGNLSGHEDFPQKAKTGDILITGHNFGCGSSRQQAVDGFIALGIKGIIGESFGAIYKRNAINAGFPLLERPGILESGLKNNEDIEVNFETGEIKGLESGAVIKCKPLSQVQKDIYFAGGLMELAK